MPSILPHHAHLFRAPPLCYDFAMEYATRDAREASFAPPTKRSKAGWPHKAPTPAELARVGFFYKPSTSKDNVECFTCGRNLDGWEEEDDALQEHLKHGPDCAWALLMSIESEQDIDASNMEDPTSEQLMEARRTTFKTSGWPHEKKKGWSCKVEKLVEAGWYFAPTPEYEDWVSCAYCKLSLDGWEPKDNPFDEHYRRSPHCPFFVFAGTTAPSKRPKAKKGRASKASRTSKASTRLSTQSNATMLSQADSIPDLDQSLDTSTLSVMSTASTSTAKGKRKAAGRPKGTRTKKAKTTRSKKKDAQEVEDEPKEIEDSLYPRLSQTEDMQADPQESQSQTIDENIVEDEQEITGPPKIEETVALDTESPLKTGRKSQHSAVSQKDLPVPTPQKKEARIERTDRSPSQPSDVENAPPSSRPESERPPLSSPGAPQPTWHPVDVEMVFQATPVAELFKSMNMDSLSQQEQRMTVQEWIEHISGQAETDLRAEGERVVGVFEKEGQRALTVLESIVCV